MTAFIELVLGASLVLQGLAAALAIRLVKTTGSRAWLLVAVAIALMASRRALTLFEVTSGGSRQPDMVAELIALAISASLLTGLALIRPMFERMRTMEHQLRQRERELRETLDRTPCGIVLVRDGRWSYVNGALASALGVERSALEGAEVLSSVHEDDRQRFRDGPLRAPEDVSQRQPFEARLLGRGGEVRTVDVIEGPILEHAGSLSRLLVLQDTTERRELEAQLLQAQKMEAVGQLAGGVAHDFNNLLTVILASTSLARASVNKPGADVRSSLDDVIDAAERAAALTRQLLTFSRKSTGNARPLDLSKNVAAAAGMLERLVGEQVALKSELGEVPTVSADPTQLEQVLVNLVVNARDAMPRGGAIRIVTRADRVHESGARPWAGASPGEYAVLSVRDEGEGMPPHVLARAFEPFFTTKESGKGTGLGLATSYAIAKRAGGGLVARSRPGEGSEFELWLPALAGETEAAQSSPRQRAEGSSGRETILVVDDEPQLLTLSKRVLGARGYEVLEAADGPSALALLEANRSRVALLFTDLRMRGMSGLELADRARALSPRLRVIVTSGHTLDLEGRADVEFLPKPYTPDALADRVRKVLDHPTRHADSG